MAYFIRLERKEDLEWLEKVLANSVDKLRSGNHTEILGAASENIMNCYDAVITAVPAKQKTALGVEDEFSDKNKEQKSNKENPKDDYVPGLCPTHPKNAIKRAPRTNCSGCWAAYKKLHPLEYEQNRRKFERKLKVAE